MFWQRLHGWVITVRSLSVRRQLDPIPSIEIHVQSSPAIADRKSVAQTQSGTERASVEDQLEHQPGKQLAIVCNNPRHRPIDEWVYNRADIDGQKVIWAHDMDMAHNSELIHYYKDRKVWLMNTDRYPSALVPYSDEANVAAI